MIYPNEKWLITGGTGSFSEHAIPYILNKYHPNELVVFSRDEYKQFNMRKDAASCIRFEIGDIRDKPRLDRAMNGVRYVIHTAALKHVRTAEDDPLEAIKTNVAGTSNVVEAANRVGARMVLLSTDKACEPINAYGATKMLAERITLAGNQSVVRYGNVMGSRGSVLHLFNQFARHGVFTITDKRCTRFAVTFKYAIDLATHALDAEYREPMMLVSKANAFRIVDLAAAFVDEPRFEEIGLYPGEKLHETLLSCQEMARAVDMSYYYYLPMDNGGKINKLQSYNSGDTQKLTVADLKGMVKGL